MLELREPLHQELVGNPMQHCLPIQGDVVCARKAQDGARSEPCELCSSDAVWVSAPSFGNRLQTHRGGARQNQLAAAMLLLALPESERKRESREGGSTKGFFWIYGSSARTF